MNRSTSRAFALVPLFAFVLGAATSKAEAVEKRRFTSRDSVEMSYFGTLIHSEPLELDDDGIVSPDGRYIVKLTHRGVLPEGVTEGTVWLFDATQVRKSINTNRADVPAPIPLVHMAAAANGMYAHFNDAGNIIFQLSWAEDSRSLAFLGRSGRENRQLFTVDLNTKEIRTLTPDTQDVVAYSRSGSAFAYLVSADVKPNQEWISSGPGIPDMTIGTGTPLLPLLYPNFVGESFSHPAILQLWRVRGDAVTPIIDQTTKAPLQITTSWTAIAIGLSPDASRVFIIARIVGPNTDGNAKSVEQPLNYRLIDMQEGKEVVSFATPIADYDFHNMSRYRAVWSPDGTEVALSETKRLATQGQGADGAHRCTVAIVDLSRQKSQCGLEHDAKSSASLRSMRWDDSGKRVFVRLKQSDTGIYSNKTLERNRETWTSRKRSHDSSESLVLTVNQSLNSPPVLAAFDELSGKSRQIFDPNPQLADIDMGFVSVYVARSSGPHHSRRVAETSWLDAL